MDAGTRDILAGISRWRDWLTLGWYDFSIHYRRTLMGPFWQTIQVGIWVLGLTLVFGRHEGQGIHYVAYVATGVTFWNFLSSSLTNGAGVFNRRANLIRNLENPLSLHVFRSITESTARLGFQFLAFFAIVAYSPDLLTPATLMFIPGLLAVLFTVAWVAPLMGIIGSRYHDTEHFLSVLMRFLFFTTPIFWVARETSGARTWLAALNPFTHFLEIVRAPLLGEMPGSTAWTVVLCITLPGSLISYYLFRRCRQSIVFWV